MTGSKMSAVLEYLQRCGVTLRGVVVSSSSGGELSLETNGQPPRHVHDRLVSWGFVLGGDPANLEAYVYRPRKKT